MENTRSLFGIKKSKNIPVPPGFVSLTSFTLKSVEDSKESSAPSSFNHPCETEINGLSYSSSRCDVSTIDLKNKPWILNRQPSSEVKVPCPEPEGNMPLKVSLPRGVNRGCSSCPNCIKVTSGWCPEESRWPILESAPAFYPTEEEFKDPLQYISSIRPKAEQFGICSIVPPPSWEPPCIFRRKNAWIDPKFKTQIQQIGDLTNLSSSRTFDDIPGNITLKRKRVSNGNTEPYDGGFTSAEEAQGNDSFKSEVGPEFTLEAFKGYADDFKRQYFCKKGNYTDSSTLSGSYQEKWELSVRNIEGEFWRIVEKPTEEIEVICGANIDTREFQSGFPVKFDILEKPKHAEYVASSWNLNNVSKLPGSFLQFENSDNCAPSVPQVFIGMCLSSHCWKLEEHQLYSLSYLHLGSTKVWYGIPARYCYKFEEVMKKHLPQYSEHPEMLGKLSTELSPSVLKSEGIPVYRCIQRPKQFVITFPGAYHYELDCGFNVMETVNFAPFDWLPFGHHATELYREQGRKTSISYDKLLLGGAMAVVRAQWETLHMKRELLPWSSISGKDGVLTNLLKIRFKQEARKKKYLCSYLLSEKMKSDFDVYTKMECRICFCDLHLSAIGCLCSPGKYTCAVHANHFCSAASDSKRYLFRFEVDELNLLIRALEGDMAAVETWGMAKLGLKIKRSDGTSYYDMKITGNPSEPPASGGAGAGAATVGMKPPSVILIDNNDAKEENPIVVVVSPPPSSRSSGDVIIIDDDES